MPTALRSRTNPIASVRFRIDFTEHCSVGIGKIELLEAIERIGSLSGAARALHMSYRRAWLLLQDLNQGFDHPVAAASVGGRGGGGVQLTAFGQQLVSGYRQAEIALQALVERHLAEASAHATAADHPAGPSAAPIRRRLPPRRRSQAAG